MLQYPKRLILWKGLSADLYETKNPCDNHTLFFAIQQLTVVLICRLVWNRDVAELIKFGLIPLDLITTIWCEVKLHQIQISTKFLRSLKPQFGLYLTTMRKFRHTGKRICFYYKHVIAHWKSKWRHICWVLEGFWVWSTRKTLWNLQILLNQFRTQN